MPLPLVAGARAALRAFRTDPSIRAALWERVEQLGDGLGEKLHSPIASVVLGGEGAAQAASARLMEMGFHVPAIRPPTVPPGTSRLRITVSADHTLDDVDALLNAVSQCIGSVGPAPEVS